ncbi:MAG: D-alanyl-D-alanine carboxypeptidase family protein [Faecousia sp.]
MKKLRFLSLLLCLLVLAQLVMTPVSAAETTGTPQATDPTVQQAAQIPFGRVSIENGCRTINGMRPLAGSDRRLDTAQAAFVYETNTDTVIYSYNPDTKLPTGTLAKIVTALVAIENSNLDDIVTCSDGIQSKVPGSSLKLTPNLKSGEQLTVEDLLHALLMIGANDAAVALAEHVAGTTKSFLDMMNMRVKQMGCISTEFGNISGLDTATSYTTAREMAKIVMEATKNETFAEIFGATQYTIPATNLVEAERKLTTTNYLVDDHIITQFMSTRFTGGLPSYTENTGASIVSTAEYNNMRVVFVVMGATRVTNYETGSVTTYGNFEEMTELANYVFNYFKINRIIYDGMAVNQWPVSGGECEVVGQSFTDVDTVVPAGVQMKNLIMNYTVEGGGMTAPIKKDDKIATVEVWYQNSCVTEVELYAMADVRAVGDIGVSVRGNGDGGISGGSKVLSVIGTVCVIVLGLVGVYLAFNSFMRSRRRARTRRRRAERRRSR